MTNDNNPLILVFNTALSDGTTIAFFLGAWDTPLDATIDWGDGNLSSAYSTHDEPEEFSHTYTKDGTYTVRISGTVPSLGDFIDKTKNINHHNKLVAVESFGDVGLVDLENAFSGARHLTSVPKHLPSTVEILSGMFANHDTFDGHEPSLFNDPNITHWETSNITTMNFMFSGATSFNQPIGCWDTSNVVDMTGMFCSAHNFNQPLNSWNTSNVKYMSLMFCSAHNFNQPLGDWNTSQLTETGAMFAEATSFNQPLNSWQTTNIVDMESMFRDATSFNQPLDKWDTSNVTSMYEMFQDATAFNQPIGNWDTRNVTDMSFMFKSATAFNQPIGNWNTSSVADTSFMFYDAQNFNQPLAGWTLSSLTDAIYALDCTNMTAENLSLTLEGWANGLMATLTASPDVTLALPISHEQLSDAGQQAIQELVRHSRWTVVSPSIRPQN